jgi:hypothetical protein
MIEGAVVLWGVAVNSNPFVVKSVYSVATPTGLRHPVLTLKPAETPVAGGVQSGGVAEDWEWS